MLFRVKAISLVLLLEAILVQVNGVPLRVIGPQEGSSEEKDRVKEATADAHHLVTKMEDVHGKAANGDAASLAKIHQAFGAHANVHAIGENIQKLKDGKFRMEQARDHNHAGPGYYHPDKKVVELGSAFHSGNSAEDKKHRAGTIIHESSHAILGTKDIFDKHGQPTSRGKPTNAGDKVGYKDSHLPEMVHDPNFSKNLHHNADSYRVFADLCRRQLERRALEEPDLMKRDEILQARAVACALPHRKPTTPGKAAGHDKGGKLAAHHGAKTPANGRKATSGKSLLKGGKHTLSHGIAKIHGKSTARGGKVNGGIKHKAAAAPKNGGKLAAHHAAHGAKTPAHGKKATTGKSLFKGGKHAPSHGAAKTPARGGKVNGGTKHKVAAAFKKVATHAASKKAPSHAKGRK